MKELKRNEIQFIKDTQFTPTVLQCDEYNRIGFNNYIELKELAKSKYKVNLDKLSQKLLDEEGNDCIQLDYTAVYLLYSLFTLKELEDLTPKKTLDWLKDFKYFNGYRKWSEQQAQSALNDAILLYKENKSFYKVHGHMWYKDIF